MASTYFSTLVRPEATERSGARTHVRRAVSLRLEDDQLWQRVKELLEAQTGRAGWVGSLTYALRLAERHLSGSADPPTPLSPLPPSPSTTVPLQHKPARSDRS